MDHEEFLSYVEYNNLGQRRSQVERIRDALAVLRGSKISFLDFLCKVPLNAATSYRKVWSPDYALPCMRSGTNNSNTLGINPRRCEWGDTFDATVIELTPNWHCPIGHVVYKTLAASGYHPAPAFAMDKVHSKFKKTNRGFEYHYLFSQALPGKPTLLFIHGFPSTSYDWYQQINYFQPKGYGLVVPDLLGYGRTEPKSTDPADFLHTAVAQDLLDILDEEGVRNVIAIGHDWGSCITAILSIKHSDRFLGFAFISVTYIPPSVFPPLDVIFEHQKQSYGRPLMGYWTLFRKEDAAGLIEANIESFIDILYVTDPEVWKTYINLPGELETFIRQKQRLSRAPYLTPEHYEHIKRTLLQGGLNSPLNWYKSNLQGVNNSIKDTLSEEDIKIKKPAFMAVAKYDYVCPREFAITEIEKYAKGGLTIVEFDTGHWLQLEKPEEHNDALDRWVTNTFKL